MSAAPELSAKPGMRRVLLQPASLLALEAGVVFALLVALLSMPLLREAQPARQVACHFA